MVAFKKKLQKAALITPSPEINEQVDSELVDDLLTQLDSRDPVVQNESASVLQTISLDNVLDSSHKKDSKSRFRERQARKAATLAKVLLPDDPQANARIAAEAKGEKDAIQKVCNQLGLEIFEINPDGHCLFSAIADQLALLGLVPPPSATYPVTRAVAADYIQAHRDDFLPFLPSVAGEDTLEAHNSGLIGDEQFKTYCKAVRETGTWGGEPEIVALSRAFNVPIHVVQGGKPPIVIHHPSGGESSLHDPAVWLSYHRRLYGLGEHYNSLRPKRAK